MLTHRGFSAWIVSDDNTLPEYLVAVDAKTHRVSCWIPSEEGQSFTVYWRDHGGKVDSCAFITLDGFVVPGRFLFGTGVAWRQGVRTGTSTERPFVFKKVEESEGESSAQALSKDVGMVTLRIKRVERVGSRPANPIQEIPETSLGKRKAGELCIGFGDEKQAFDQCASTWSVKPHDKDVPDAVKASSYVSFIFRYRSREFLQAQGIMTETDVETPELPKRAPVRRVASAPVTGVSQGFPVASSLATPSPSPPKKKLKPTNFLRNGPHRLRRPSDMRRAVSWKVITTQPEGFPGEGMIKFDQKPEVNISLDDNPGDAGAGSQQ